MVLEVQGAVQQGRRSVAGRDAVIPRRRLHLDPGHVKPGRCQVACQLPDGLDLTGQRAAAGQGQHRLRRRTAAVEHDVRELDRPARRERRQAADLFRRTSAHGQVRLELARE